MKYTITKLNILGSLSAIMIFLSFTYVDISYSVPRASPIGDDAPMQQITKTSTPNTGVSYINAAKIRVEEQLRASNQKVKLWEKTSENTEKKFTNAVTPLKTINSEEQAKIQSISTTSLRDPVTGIVGAKDGGERIIPAKSFENDVKPGLKTDEDKNIRSAEGPKALPESYQVVQEYLTLVSERADKKEESSVFDVNIDKAVEAATSEPVLPEMKKAQDELVHAIATIILSQAMPDLINEKDAYNLKSIFSGIERMKTDALEQYQHTTKVYYEELKKTLSKNIALLQLKNILSGNMSQEDMDNLPRGEIDRIIKKIRDINDRTFEEEYILQQEAKYREKYKEPAKNLLEEKLRLGLKHFTGKVSAALENTDLQE